MNLRLIYNVGHCPQQVNFNRSSFLTSASIHNLQGDLGIHSHHAHVAQKALRLYTHIRSSLGWGIMKEKQFVQHLFQGLQGSPQKIKVEWYGILIFINIDHESH